jgi:hypothetical protein
MATLPIKGALSPIGWKFAVKTLDKDLTLIPASWLTSATMSLRAAATTLPAATFHSAIEFKPIFGKVFELAIKREIRIVLRLRRQVAGALGGVRIIQWRVVNVSRQDAVDTVFNRQKRPGDAPGRNFGRRKLRKALLSGLRDRSVDRQELRVVGRNRAT